MKRVLIPTTTSIHTEIEESGSYGKEVNKQLHSLAAAASALSKLLESRGVKVVRFPVDSEAWLQMFKHGGNHETMEVYKSLVRDSSPTPYIRRCMDMVIFGVMRVPYEDRVNFLAEAYKLSEEQLAEHEWKFEPVPQEEQDSDPEETASEAAYRQIVDRLMVEDEVEDALRSYRTDPVDAAKRRVIECILDEAEWLNELKEMKSE